MKVLPVYLLLVSMFYSFTALAAEVWVIPVQGAIGPASSDYISRELDLANKNHASLVILKMDTPGGLDSAMRDIIRAITVSSVPVATWVGPSGARAASAGTYILFASHFAVMANATNLGAATPVSIGIQGSKPSPEQEQKDKPSQETEESSSPPVADNKKVSAKTNMEKKVINDATAYIKGLAKLHGRNEQWAEKAVTEAASLDAQEALAENVIDFIADDLKQLVKLADGRRVLVKGAETRLDLDQVNFVERIPDWRFAFLATITNPNVAYILMLIGIYGLLLEFYNPGLGLPGVLGGICLLMGMYALQMLPVNYAGLALILLGIALLAAEAFSPSFGIFGLGGIAAFALGSIFLMDSEMPAFQIALPLIAGFSITSVLFTFVIIGMLLRVRRKAVTTGVSCMVGQTAAVVSSFNQGEGWVEVGGEIWQARCAQDLLEGQLAAVQAVSGLWLQVTLITEQEIQQAADK
ncbi:NfeD family protein [Psychromonas ossibalaenae]|uniref:NfeD family protein n=1 Tax=Psychromonas ossibalaenae TaxID=444922 RepID=UPI00035E5AAC|nr:nodulation protein NfeD [Psychromonas ossibalaenae]